VGLAIRKKSWADKKKKMHHQKVMSLSPPTTWLAPHDQNGFRVIGSCVNHGWAAQRLQVDAF
jgi:hypothetical protein